MADNGPLSKYSLRELYGHKRKVYTLGWNCTGKKLASGSADHSIRIWNIEPHGQVSKPERAESELKGHSDSVCHLAWKPNSPDLFASTTSADKSIRLWDVRGNKPAGVVSTSAGNIFLTWSPEGNSLAVDNKENSISFVDVRKLKIAKTHKMQHEINEIHWGPTVNHFMASTGEGSVDIMAYPSLEVLWSLKSHSTSCYCFSISKDHRYLATGGADAIVGLWDLQDMVCIRTMTRMDQPVRTLNFSGDGRFLAYASEDNIVEVVSVPTGEVLQTFKLRSYSDSVAWNPIHPILAFAEEKEDTSSRDRLDRVGVICIYAPPKSS